MSTTQEAPTVLLVDDEERILAAYRRKLRKHFDVRTALGGNEGLVAVERRGPFAVVVSDLRMPGMDGIRFLSEVKKRAPDTVRIMLTGDADLRAAIDAVNEGNVYRFHTKPCDLDDLARSIADGIHKFNLRRNAVAENSRLVAERRRAREALRSARKQADISARQAERERARARAVVDTVGDGIVIFDGEGIIESFSPAAEAMFGYTAAEIVGRNMSVLTPKFDWRAHASSVEQSSASGASETKDATIEAAALCKDGKTVLVEMSIKQSLIADDRVFTAVFRDIRERKEAEETIRGLALKDALTGLPNRGLFHSRLIDTLGAARARDRLVAVMFLDLDRFKDVNDSHGHPVGDALLKSVARILKTSVRAVDMVARLGGDEFAIVIGDLKRAGDAETFARRIIEQLSEPLSIEGHVVHAGTSIGISVYPGDGDEPDELVRNADLALYEAKADGRATYRYFDVSMRERVTARNALRNDLRVALERGQFALHYQAQFALSDLRLVGAEALLRWCHPERGLIPPGEFIPATEASGLVIPIGEWVLRTACAQCQAWRGAGLDPPRVAVNISPRQFRDDAFFATVEVVLNETGLAPELLELEITEGMMMDDADSIIERLHRLNRLGVSLSIDDFGTGYSSLAYLKRLPVQRLKIDQSFIKDVTHDSDSAAIVDAVVKLGQSLDLTVVAEGVETEQQIAHLRDLGCDEVQGFLLGRPASANDFGEWISARSTQCRPRSSAGLGSRLRDV